MIKEGNCVICGKEFRRRYSRKQNEPMCCSRECYYKRLKTQLWANKKYKQHLSDAHKGNPGYWTGKERLDMRGANNPKWKGGHHKWLGKDGYIRIGLPEYFGRGKYIKEHRFVMEKHLGRKLTKVEVVHHINGIGTDNRIENLMLFKNNGEHLTYHKKLRELKKQNANT